MSAKPELQPPSQPRTFASDPNASRLKFLAVIGFIILAAGAVVVVLLPSIIAKRLNNRHLASQASPIESQLNEEPAADANKNQAQSKIDAQEMLQQVLRLQARLENEGIKIWGEEPFVTSYGEVLTSLSDANAYLDKQLFDKAADRYRETIEKLEQLAASRPERTNRAIQAAHEALEQLDSEGAKRHYKIVLAADALNSEALAGLQRAENLPQVLEQIAQAQIHEANGELELARQKYIDTISLDKDFQAAHAHLRRVEASIKERDFRQAMSDAISALNKKEFGQTKLALDTAQNLRPDAASVRDLRLQLENTEQLVQLQRLRNQALQHEQTEQWEKALKAYNRALKIDASTGFALRGKLRAEKLIEVNRQVQNYLANPDDLQSPKHMDRAREIYEMAVAKNDSGPKFRDNTEKLGELLELYNKLVSVLLQSDDMTDVRVYRVGHLGHFLEHRLELRPGRYKALGTRSGYRDVSISFTVPVTVDEMTLTVYCKEKI